MNTTARYLANHPERRGKRLAALQRAERKEDEMRMDAFLGRLLTWDHLSEELPDAQRPQLTQRRRASLSVTLYFSVVYGGSFGGDGRIRTAE